MTCKKWLLVNIVLLVSPFLSAQQSLTKDQQDVQQTVIKLFDALSKRDSVGLRKYCTADIELIEYGNTWNADSLILKAITLNTATDFSRVNKIDFLNTTVSGNNAWATYRLQSEITGNGKHSVVRWLETVVAVKERKKWKIRLLHSTLIQRS